MSDNRTARSTTKGSQDSYADLVEVLRKSGFLARAHETAKRIVWKNGRWVYVRSPK